MSPKARDILEELARANPVTEKDLPDAALGEEGREIWLRIRARNAETRVSRRHRYRVSWIVGGAAVVLIAVLVPLYLLTGSVNDKTADRGSSRNTTGATGTQHPVTTQHPIAVAAPPEVVTRNVALAGIIQLARDLGLADAPRSAEPSVEARLISTAQAMKVLRPSEGPDYNLGGVASRKQYAVWLWRGFGDYLPAKSSVEFKDVSSLTTEELRAVRGLAAAGVLEGSKGIFNGNAPLTPQAEHTLLDRVKLAILAQG